MEFKKGDDVFGWDECRQHGNCGKYFAFDDYSVGEMNNTHIIFSENVEMLLHFKNCEPRRPDLKVDDPVMVRNGCGDWERRHFSEWSESGKIATFPNGMTKFSSGGYRFVTWDEYRLPTKDELKK